MSEVYVALAKQAAAKAQEAYDAASESGNPYARAMVTQVLADGGLIALNVARGDRIPLIGGSL